MPHGDQAKALIQTRFPGWVIWLSDAGRWYATRRGRLSDDELHAGYAMTVAADTPERLAALLAAQSRPRPVRAAWPAAGPASGAQGWTGPRPMSGQAAEPVTVPAF